MQENKIIKTGIFQPPFLTVENQSSSIFVQNMVNTPGKEENLLMVANSADAPTPPVPGGLMPILYYGGIPVAVIFAIAVLLQIHLKYVTEVLKEVNKHRK
ncbi:hypothetical protein BMF77_03055 [Dolichospermum sp. UHCC 0315A]|uniref:hypothetical protein n=1 Tax=Dolichospermum sp. UHCC 0315A TaxID=1914871 RepID=UPI0011E833AB|nr:hypothetical protein [Dolichospermum sp. UHCC 0315A]QEI42447.1 hypothetical protein BMF77_03055 [Dolichospermum sp. UHCC 0315A]